MQGITTGYISNAINQLVNLLGIKEEVSFDLLYSKCINDDLKGCAEDIARYLGLPIDITLSYVPSGQRSTNNSKGFSTNSLSKTNRSKQGVSANQVKRTIGVSYKTAWYLCHRIRNAMTESRPRPLSGIVEVDETWIGGKKKDVGHGYKGNKVAVVGAIERGGDVRMKVVSARDRKTLHEFIDRVTADDTEAIYTDEWPAYNGCGDENTRHESVNHSAEEWVSGDVHTNNVENI